MEKTVLVVDDSRLSRRMAADALRDAGFHVIEAQNGEEGLAAFSEHAPCFVVTDLLMPVMDGFGLVAGIRGLSQTIPIVVVSADVQAVSRNACEEHGEVSFLNKPVNAASLVEIVTAKTSQSAGMVNA